MSATYPRNLNVAWPDSYQVTIAATGTPQNALAPSGNIFKFATQVTIQCPTTNTSDITIGGPDRQALVVAKGTSVTFYPLMNNQSQSAKFDLSELFIKAGTNGDKANIMLFQPTGLVNVVEL